MPRTYEVRTYGCQMNVHDSERLTGLLEEAGYVAAAPADDQADVVVFNTCAVRENADNKLYGNLGHLAPVKAKRPGMQIAVGGCLAQKDRSEITRKAPWVDVVFGTHNIGSLPALLERARVQRGGAGRDPRVARGLPVDAADPARVGVRRLGLGLRRLQQHLHVLHRPEPARQGEGPPARRHPGRGPRAGRRGRQRGHPAGAERQRLRRGVRRPAGVLKLLRACGEVEGLERVRFTSPHPAEFTDDVIAAMAETPNVMPQLHMPLQSGSDRILKAMRRSYRREKYLGIIDRVRAAMPDAAITTDIIVGFPGETEEDFAQTLEVVAAARFSRRLHVPVLQAARYAGRHAPRPGAARRGAAPLRAAGRARQRHRLGREQAAGRSHASS